MSNVIKTIINLFNFFEKCIVYSRHTRVILEIVYELLNTGTVFVFIMKENETGLKCY